MFFNNAYIDVETFPEFVNVYKHECILYVFIQSELKISDKGMCDTRVSFCIDVDWAVLHEGEDILKVKE